jgi:hypothetical protein
MMRGLKMLGGRNDEKSNLGLIGFCNASSINRNLQHGRLIFDN